MKTQNQIFNYMKVLSKKSSITDENLNEIEQYIYDHLGYKPKEGLVHTDRKERVAYLKQLLDRPLRVCGMVKNEGEPGGGPFWVEDNEHATLDDRGERSSQPERSKSEKNIHPINPL